MNTLLCREILGEKQTVEKLQNLLCYVRLDVYVFLLVSLPFVVLLILVSHHRTFNLFHYPLHQNQYC